MKSSWVLVVVLLGAVAVKGQTAVSNDDVVLSIQAYDVEIVVDGSSSASFQAEATLSTAAVGPQHGAGSDVILLHAKHLDLSDVTVTRTSGAASTVSVTRVVMHADREQVEIQLGAPLEQNATYEVRMKIRGQLGLPSDFGLIRVPYQENAEERWLAVFRSSPTAARSVFPCVDLPDAAAQFSLRVRRPITHTALANGKLSRTEAVDDTTARDTFATATFAPHQLGLVVAPLVRVGDSGQVELWVRKQGVGAANQGAVLECVSTLSNLTENISGLPLALDHLSIVALPGLSGVASTAGLVTLDEASVLSLQLSAPSSARLDALLQLADAVAEPAVRAAARPLGHWGDAWASRGLAAHMRYRLADQAESGWLMGQQQDAAQVQDVLEEGGWEHSRPLPSGVDVAALGQGAVSKGSSLIRMLETALSPKVFDSAVQLYYVKSEGKSVDVDDLYDAFAYESYRGGVSDLPMGITVPLVMMSWARLPGYPVLTVTRDYETNLLTVSQERFLWNSSAEQTGRGDEQSEWWVPLSYTYATEVNRNYTFRDWMVPGENDMPITIDHMEASHWTYFNLNQAAPFRVNYDLKNWQMLSKELNSVALTETLGPAARAQLLGDALALARAGRLDYAPALDLANYLRVVREDAMLPWLVARRSLRFLEDHLDDDGLARLRMWERELLKEVYLDAEFDVGGPQQDPDVRLLREEVVRWACEAGLPSCLNYTDTLYRQWRERNTAPKPEELEAVLCRAIRQVGDDALQSALDTLAGSRVVGGERLGYVRALSCAPTRDLLGRAIGEALKPSGPFLASEVDDLLEATISQRPHGWSLVAEYLGRDYETIANRSGNVGDLRVLSHLLASKVSSRSQYDTVMPVVRTIETFLGDVEGSLSRSVEEELAVNLAWTDRFRDDVVDWLRVNAPEPEPDAPTTAFPGGRTTTAGTTTRPGSSPGTSPSAGTQRPVATTTTASTPGSAADSRASFLLTGIMLALATALASKTS